ncbi:MAG: HAMP domain-containing protein [Chloroflexi bacterium]|nr:HAMP domain-containing protein [Chloroflexota bacterium]
MKAILRFLKDLYSGPFQATLVFSFTLVAAITIGVGTWVISTAINNYLSEVMDEQVARDIHLAETFYELKLADVGELADHISQDVHIIGSLGAAIRGDVVDILRLDTGIGSHTSDLAQEGRLLVAILDADGNLIAGQLVGSNAGTSIIHGGGNWLSLPIIERCIEGGLPIRSTEIIPREYLEQVGLEQQAAIPLIDTPRAALQPFDPREGTAGLALTAASPIFNLDGQVEGLALVFHLFNNDFTLVDQVKDAAQIDTVTIFMGDLRVSTNVMTSEGLRAVGTRVSQEVGEVVLFEGREYVGAAFVVDQDYITRYEPLLDHAGQVVGMLYVGLRQASFLRLLTTFDQRAAVVAVLTILMTFLLATPVSRFITRPLKELRELVLASRKVAEGDLSARAPVVAKGEVGLVAESFNAMLDNLQDIEEQLLHSEKLASLGQLAAGVAHELNNPLATILLYSETMLKEMGGEAAGNPDLLMVVSETKRCKRIVADLLNFARQNQVIAQPTDIHAILQDLIDLSPRRVKTVRVDFKTEFDPALPVIEGDPSQLRQVFQNLMTNAVESMPQGGTLTLRTRPAPPGMVTIEVQDTGVGISPENLNKLFLPFFTTKPIGKGTGLGLAIVYGIIKMHRGQINVRSAPGEGATFIVTLPLHLPLSGEGVPSNRPSGDEQNMIG